MVPLLDDYGLLEMEIVAFLSASSAHDCEDSTFIDVLVDHFASVAEAV